VTTQQVKDAWPQILEAVQRAKRSAWMVVFTAQVRSLNGDVLTLSFPSDNDVQSFRQPEAGGALGTSEYLRQAIVDVLGIRVKFIARADSSPGGGGSPRPSGGAPTAPAADTWPGAEPSGAPAVPAGGGSATGTATAEAPTGAAPSRPSAAPAASAGATASRADSSSGASAGVVTEWATVAIPSSPAGEAAAAVSTTSAMVTLERPASTVAPAPSAAPDVDEPPFDDVPPPESEPPYEPPVPEEPAGDWSAAPSDGAASRAAAPAPSRGADDPARSPRPSSAPAAGARTPTFQQPQRYGEAVVREILGATFLEEQPAPPIPGTR
jgi:DNA polymerase-3 subunit gamma/tau